MPPPLCRGGAEERGGGVSYIITQPLASSRASTRDPESFLFS